MSAAAASSPTPAGQIRPLIGRTFPLTAVPEAIRYLADGQAVGKVVVTV